MSKARKLAVAAVIVAAIVIIAIAATRRPPAIPVPPPQPGMADYPRSKRGLPLGVMGYAELNVNPPHPGQAVYSPAWLRPGMSAGEALQGCVGDQKCAAVMLITKDQQAAREGKSPGRAIPSLAEPPAAIYPVTTADNTIVYGQREPLKGPIVYIKPGVVFTPK